MKKHYFLAAGLLAANLSFGQNWCATDHYHEQRISEHPEWAAQMHEHLVRITSGEIVAEERADECIIPVVVHVIHEGGDDNISYEQILSGIDMLNEDFNRLNADTLDTRNTATAPFLPIAANMNIQFELAKLDPDGNCTNGVERRYSPGGAVNANDASKHYSTGGLDAWNRNDYFNIWIVKSIESSGAGVTLGYAQFPYFGVDSNYGVIIRSDVFGTIGTASGDRTLPHEVGHCLGLLHTFQGGCHSSACDEDGDYVCDTPPVSEAQWSCATTQNTCDDIPGGDPYGFDALDQFENFMSYSPCQNMFSEGQKAIVDGNFSSIAMFGNLTSEANLAQTGVGTPEVLCKAEFTSDLSTICAGNDVAFTDLSYFNVTGWTWTFEGGTPSSSSVANPTVTYETGGTYDVTLEVTDGISTVSTTLENYITVLANPGEAIPYKEGFEGYTTVGDGNPFTLINEDSDVTWELLEDADIAYGGNNCVWIDNFAEFSETQDHIISGTIDLSGVDPSDEMVFYFHYAYKKRSASNNESLKFYVSKDCGETWALRKNIQGNNLSSETQTSPFTPADKHDWEKVTITNINDTYYVSDFRYKFVFENDGGNNFYLDNINMYPASMAGIVDPEVAENLSVYPNPTSDNISIEFFANEGQDYKIEIYTPLGQKVATVFEGPLKAGLNSLDYSTNELSKGIYVVKVETEGRLKTIKLIKD
ncbi:MAG: T9SS type A sorting domain-containing protein [Flavobacteriales bacterium]|nr:T9SS type A sorting domain-containing protein [Flavobacteriales bacterium]